MDSGVWESLITAALPTHYTFVVKEAIVTDILPKITQNSEIESFCNFFT